MHFVDRDFGCANPKETCHQGNQGTRKKENKRKAMQFLNMLIVFINRHAAELFHKLMLSTLKHYHKRVGFLNPF